MTYLLLVTYSYTYTVCYIGELLLLLAKPSVAVTQVTTDTQGYWWIVFVQGLML